VEDLVGRLDDLPRLGDLVVALRDDTRYQHLERSAQ
jgi:hypothetical protein